MAYTLLEVMKEMESDPKTLETSKLIKSIIKSILIIGEFENNERRLHYTIQRDVDYVKERLTLYNEEINIRIPKDS